MQILIDTSGDVHCVYGESIDLASIGDLHIRRASHVEPDEAGTWRADLSPVGGPTLGPFPSRSTALAAEGRWLSANWLPSPLPHAQYTP